jgi:hypothetical protein
MQKKSCPERAPDRILKAIGFPSDKFQHQFRPGVSTNVFKPLQLKAGASNSALPEAKLNYSSEGNSLSWA